MNIKKGTYGWELHREGDFIRCFPSRLLLVEFIIQSNVRPIIAPLFCFLAGHTFRDEGMGSYKCQTCGRRL